MKELYLGLMSGTSRDAIDAVLVDLDGTPPTLVAHHCPPLPTEIRHALAQLERGGKRALPLLGRLDTQLGQLFAQASVDLLHQAGIEPSQVKGIGSHGQTVYHQPNTEFPFSLQIGDPNIIAARTGITTVADFRRGDLAVGGEGAPLVPGFHASVFRSQRHDRVVLNIGGMANITILPHDLNAPVTGFDTGPGNVLMDSWIARSLRQDLDEGGKWGASGKVDPSLLERMLRDPYFDQAPPKSTGREYFNDRWLDTLLKRHRKRLYKKNVQATLCELTAQSITHAITTYAPQTKEVLVCGGGSHNMALLFRLQVLLGAVPVKNSADFGMDPDFVEAMAFAWLARQTIMGRPGNLPSVTGADREVVLGAIYNG